MNRRRSRGGRHGAVSLVATVFLPLACGTSSPKDSGPARDETVASSSSALIDAPANNGVITIANLSHQTGNTDAADAANVGRLDEPAALAVAADGTIYIADWGNNSVRRLQPNAIGYILNTYLRGKPNLLRNTRGEFSTINPWSIYRGTWGPSSLTNYPTATTGYPYDGSGLIWGIGQASNNIGELYQRLSASILAPYQTDIANNNLSVRLSALARSTGSTAAAVNFYNSAFNVLGSYDNQPWVSPSTWTKLARTSGQGLPPNGTVEDARVPVGTANIDVSLLSGSSTVYTYFDAVQLRPFRGGETMMDDAGLVAPAALALASNGDLWVGDDGGIMIVNSTRTSFTRLPSSGTRVQSISLVDDGTAYWADSTTPNLFARSPTGVMYRANVTGGPNEEPLAVAASRNGAGGHNLWVTFRNWFVALEYNCPTTGITAGATVTCLSTGRQVGQGGKNPAISQGFIPDMDGTAGGEKLGYPQALALGNFGELLIGDERNSAIFRSLLPLTQISAGSGQWGSTDSNSSGQATFNSPTAIAATPDGGIVVADRMNNAIRKIVCGGANVCASSSSSQYCRVFPLDDRNICTTDSCMVLGIKRAPADGLSCNDGNVCTTSDICGGGACLPGPLWDVDDRNACTIDACDSTTGPSHARVSVDDGVVCTIDRCDPATGIITHDPAIFPDSNPNDCIVPVCDPATGNAVYVTGPEGTSCGPDRRCDISGVCEAAVPPPVPPTLPANGATSFGDSTKFIFEGAGKVQTGVATGTIDAAHAGWFVGYVKTATGNPMANVVVSVVDQPKYGQTTTRADGRFDIIVNGGAYYTLRFSKSGHFASDRRSYVGWEETSALEDVILLTPDATKSTSLLSGSQSQQVAIGSTSSDGGTRTPVVVVPANTSVYVDGAAQPLSSMTMRVTEYTTGVDGMKRMPAPLAAATGYTYAAEISLDEALAAKKVEFKDANGNPIDVYFYLENFLGFSVGDNVPSGFYDREKATWVASRSGRVIKIIKTGSTSGIDVTGDGVVDNVTADATLGFTGNEVTTLLDRYPHGQTLWRVPMNHMTPWDLNWPVEPPVCEGAECPPPPNPPVQPPPPLPPPPPPLPPPPPPPPPPPDCHGGSPSPGSASADNLKSGSIVRCDSQALDEEVPLPGTSYRLHYSSGRAPGYTASRQFKIDVTGATVNSQLSQVDVTIAVAGQRYEKTFLPVSPATTLAPNLSLTFVWDGNDVFNRPVIGAARATAAVTNYYRAKYAPVALFGGYPDPAAARIANPRAFVALSGRTSAMLTARSPDKGWALGGWTLNRHHFYSPASGTLFYGSGGARTVAVDQAPIQTKVWQKTPYGDDFPKGVEGAPNGDIYVSIGGPYQGQAVRIVKITPSGSVAPIVGGNSVYASCSAPPYVQATPNDGPDANNANLSEGDALAVGPDGSVYIGDMAALRKATPNADGTSFSISTIAGLNCSATGTAGDGGLATAAQLQRVADVAIGPDGTVYIADGCRIRHIDTLGIITTVAGKLGSCGGYRADEGKPATSISLPSIKGLAVGPDGSLYIQGMVQAWEMYDLIRVDPTGTLRFLTGTATVPVLDGQLIGSRKIGVAGFDDAPAGVVTRSDNSLVFIDDDNNVPNRTTNRRTYVRTADAAGVVRSIAATADTSDGTSSSRPQVGPALGNGPNWPTRLGTMPNGDVLVQNTGPFAVYRISTNKTMQVTKCPAGTAYQIPGGEEVFCFEASGRHLSTVSARTGQPLLTFGYTNGLLTSVTDDANRVTTITSAASPSRFDIVAPGKQTTTIGLDANGWASSIGDKLGVITLTTRPDGLLDDLKDRKQALFDFDYEPDGRLKSDANARGTQTLSRELLSNGRRITHKTPLGRTTTFELTIDASGAMRHTETLPDLSQIIKESFPDGIERLTAADGTVFTDTLALDPTSGDNSLASTLKTTKLPSGLSATIQKQRGAPIAITGGMSQVNKTLFGAAGDAPFSQTTLSYSTSAAPLPGIGAAQGVFLDSPLHRQTTILLDALGNPLKVQVGSLTPITLAYETSATSEDSGKLKTVTQGLRRSAFEYQSQGSSTAPDDAGYLLRVIGSYSKQRYVRDLHGRVTTAVEAEGVAATAGTTVMGWDLNGRLALVRVPSANTVAPEHKFGYDGSNLLESYTAPTVAGVSDGTTSFAPDKDLQLATETLPKELSTSTPVTVTRAYVSGTGQLDTVKFLSNGTLYPAGTLDYDYFKVPNAGSSAAGKVSTLGGPYGVNLAYLYDGFLTTQSAWSGDVVGSVAWTYNANLDTKSETVSPAPLVPAPATYVFGYDNDRLLTCVSSATSTPCNPSTLADLALTRSTEHGLVTGIAIGATTPVVEQVEYSDSAPDNDGATDTDGVDGRFGELRRQRVKVNGIQVASITYDAPTERRDDEGRIRFKTEIFGSITTDLEYQYDERGRLDFVQTGVATESFGYDLNGNRTSYTPSIGAQMTGVYDAQDRLMSYGTASGTAVGDLTFTYGPHGELLTKTIKTASESDVWTFGYDPLGNLVTVTKPGGILYTYLVDGGGRRVGRKKKLGAGAEIVEKRWLYRDELHPVAQLDSNGAIVARYVYASRANVPDLVIKGNAVYRLFSDQLGSPRMAVNVANPSDVPYRVDYSAFGVPTWKGTGSAATPAFDWIPFGFASGLYDPDTGLVRFGARDYDPSLGRWVTKDPILFNGAQTNLYAYVGSDPINWSDPSGLQTEVIVWEPVGMGGSSFGHVSIEINGRSYSWGPGGMDQDAASSYIARNQKFRSGRGILLGLSPAQEDALEDFLRGYTGDYQPLFKNCTDPIEEGLSYVGARDAELNALFPTGLARSLSTLAIGQTAYVGPRSSAFMPWSNGIIDSFYSMY